MLLSLAACSKAQPSQQEPNQPDPDTTSTPADVSTPEPSPAPPTLEPLADVAPAPQELSQEELQSYFSKAYESSSTYVSSLNIKEAIDWELDVLKLTTERENKLLPPDYAEQYKIWRPMPEQPEQQPVEKNEAPKKDQTKPGQNKTNTSQSTTQQAKPEQSKPKQQPQQSKPSGGPDIYNGFSTYKEYIDDIQSRRPDKSREELERLFPDLSTSHVDWDKYNQDIKDGYFG